MLSLTLAQQIIEERELRRLINGVKSIEHVKLQTDLKKLEPRGT
jgi:hypothetical protein